MHTELLTAWERAESKADFVSRLPLPLAIELLNQINAVYGVAVSGGKRCNLSGPRTPVYGRSKDKTR